jgi:hypothetical protein
MISVLGLSEMGVGHMRGGWANPPTLRVIMPLVPVREVVDTIRGNVFRPHVVLGKNAPQLVADQKNPLIQRLEDGKATIDSSKNGLGLLQIADIRWSPDFFRRIEACFELHLLPRRVVFLDLALWMGFRRCYEMGVPAVQMGRNIHTQNRPFESFRPRRFGAGFRLFRFRRIDRFMTGIGNHVMRPVEVRVFGRLVQKVLQLKTNRIVGQCDQFGQQ